MTTALVTGPTAGIGRAFAERCAREGLNVVLVSRDSARLEVLAEELRAEFGVQCEVMVADLTSQFDVERVAERLGRGDIRMLVNNAGFGLRSTFVESNVDEEQRMLDVLVTATMRLTHAALPAMQQADFGVIVNVSSIAGWTTGGTYAAAKSWVTVFSEGLAAQVRSTGVRVVAVCPGFVRTEFHDRAQMDVDRIPTWLWLTPQDVVDQAFADVAAGRVVSVAGHQYRLIAIALQTVPRGLIRWASPMRRMLVRRR
jgi:short-subunit dehydrogenase